MERSYSIYSSTFITQTDFQCNHDKLIFTFYGSKNNLVKYLSTIRDTVPVHGLQGTLKPRDASINLQSEFWKQSSLLPFINQ